MKILNILENIPRAARGKNKELQIHRYGKEPFDPARPKDYWYEYRFGYDVNGGDFSQEFIEAHKKTDYDKFEDIYEYIADDNGIDKANQKFVAPNEIWTAYKMGEIESHVEEDEDGKYEYLTGVGEAWIVSSIQLSNGVVANIAGKLEKKLDEEASSQIEGAHEARRDQEEYDRDPYAYYGVSRSDFA